MKAPTKQLPWVVTQDKLVNGVREPVTWTLTLGEIKIILVRGHIHDPNHWVIHCRALSMDTVSTGLTIDQPVNMAQTIAINLVTNRLDRLAAEIRRLA